MYRVPCSRRAPDVTKIHCQIAIPCGVERDMPRFVIVRCCRCESCKLMGTADHVLRDLLALVESDEYQSKVETFCKTHCVSGSNFCMLCVEPPPHPERTNLAGTQHASSSPCLEEGSGQASNSEASLVATPRGTVNHFFVFFNLNAAALTACRMGQNPKVT